MNDALTELRKRLARRHQIVGWWGLLLFLSLGITLETLHGFKIGFYLDPPHRMRRLLWTLAHAHGTLLAVVQICFALSLTWFGVWTEGRLKLASFFLIDALVLLPAGFFLGGFGHSEGDPSPGILLVPIGAIVLLIAVACIAWSATVRKDEGSPEGPPGEPGRPGEEEGGRR